MRTALHAGLVAVTVFLHAVPAAIAAESSSLRGLKPPRTDALGPLAISEPRLRHPLPDHALDLAPRIALYAGTLDSRRFVSRGVDATSGLYRAPGQSAPVLGEGNLSPLNDVIPKYTLYSQVTRVLPGGLGLGIGMRHSEYNFAAANLLALSAEGNVGGFRGAYTLYSSRTDTLGNGSAHRFQLSYLYGDRNTIGLSYTTGRDVDNLNLPLGLPMGASLADVRDLSLSGRHWLSTNWALTYDLQTLDSVYRRQGLRLGVSRSF